MPFIKQYINVVLHRMTLTFIFCYACFKTLVHFLSSKNLVMILDQHFISVLFLSFKLFTCAFLVFDKKKKLRSQVTSEIQRKEIIAM